MPWLRVIPCESKRDSAERRPRSVGNSNATVAKHATERVRLTSPPGIGDGAPRPLNWHRTERWRASWQASSNGSGHRSRWPVGSGARCWSGLAAKIPRRHQRVDQACAQVTGRALPVADLGSGQGNGRTQALHLGDRHRGLRGGLWPARWLSMKLVRYPVCLLGAVVMLGIITSSRARRRGRSACGDSQRIGSLSSCLSSDGQRNACEPRQ